MTPNPELVNVKLREEDYLTRAEAAVYAGVSLPTIDRRLKDGTLPAYRTELQPYLVRIPRSALDLLMKRRTGGRIKRPTRREPNRERQTDQSHQPTDS